MAVNNNSQQPKSLLHSLLSFIVPGLGQIIARQWARGIAILITFFALGGLSVWTVSQRARFPDFALAQKLYIPIFFQALALLIFFVALRYLTARFVTKDASSQSATNVGLGILYVLALVFVQDQIIGAVGSEDELRTIFGGTALFSAAALAGFYLWQVGDAGAVGASADGKLPSGMGGILFASLAIFTLGWNITKIDMEKAIAEYKDTQVILRRIVWPWRSAFEYEESAVEEEAKIQAPCPAGAVGPDVNQPASGESWISVTPTCGEISVRDLAAGKLALGTELTITGGGFSPGAVVEILWRNPIGNPFRPRGVGETEITMDANGEFETKLNVPEVVIPSTAVGNQIHTIIVREESGEVFTGRPSREIKLALGGMLETIMMGLVATFFGVIFAFPFSFVAARNLMAPITSILSSIVGSLLLLLPALWGAAKLTGMFAEMLGGLSEAPIQIALVLLLLTLIFGYIGAWIGSATFAWISTSISPAVGRIVTGLSLGALTAGFGYILGIGFARGIVSIPLASDVPLAIEQRYAWGWAILLGAVGMIYGYRQALEEFSIGSVIYSLARTFMNIVRSIEPIIWAIIATIWVGLGPFAGTIALTLHTIAALGKLYSESIESIDPGPLEALQATGANRLQTIVYAVVPQILPPYISFTIYRWDINVRMSTIIGAVGGGGIGFILIQWIRQFQYEPAGLAVWLITITVATLDYVSSNIRERYV